jgi:hypothetical protein
LSLFDRLSEKSLLTVHNANKVSNLGNHAANGRSVLKGALAVHLVETQANKSGALITGTAKRRSNLLDSDGLFILGHDIPQSTISVSAQLRLINLLRSRHPYGAK